ncbi:hypothetical protein ACIRPT_16965 [Streptomyces sp. NPDC101227]|uniref:hypothetical protein n=1 Tax=Streptomyces sp. NPDC101227 TaxID=3366136 RepID=UPI00380ED8F2
MESVNGGTARCVVRCIGGTARLGLIFVGPVTRAGADPGGTAPARLELTGITWYGKRVDSLDPSHSALVDLSGAGTRTLARGTVLTAAPRPAPAPVVTEAAAPPAGSAGTS